jgi:tRNA-binding EMAP/Myf-like protein
MENITFEEFKKLDLKVGEVKSAEEIPGIESLIGKKIAGTKIS